jgi:wyosine [tRNA(Phe)-imidazoG37] synthetase (radical SAM superfamily)
MELIVNENVSKQPLRGCFMTQGLYLKANGEMPCWDDVGEQKILRKLDPEALSAGAEQHITDSEELLRIRRSFLDGVYPNEGLCERCAVKTAGPTTIELKPRTLQVLHVEPSYLCHLSCPQCVPQKLRKSLKDPPYFLTPEMYAGFLNQLRLEGVDEIKLVVFEGRGDPLTSPHMEDLVRLTKASYPDANTCITTHGSFAYKPWIVSSGLDILRFSVDGAFQENYAKYRIGGKVETIFKFMRALADARAQTNSRLYIEWKYILFEWNDGDEELAEAGRLAQEFGARLRFCRTHSPGRSVTYASARDVDAMIRRLVPWASAELTFQLKDDEEFATVNAVKLDQIRGSVTFAREHLAAGDAASVCASISDALFYDGCVGGERVAFRTYEDLHRFMRENTERIVLPETAAELAGFFNHKETEDLVSPLLRRYLALAPFAADRRHVEGEAGIREAIDAERLGDYERADERAAALAVALAAGEDRLMSVLGPALTIEHPGVVVGLANLYSSRGHTGAAMLLFERYLRLAPGASDADRVLALLGQMRDARDRDLAALLDRVSVQLDGHEPESNEPGAAAHTPKRVPASAAADLDALRGACGTVG